MRGGRLTEWCFKRRIDLHAYMYVVTIVAAEVLHSKNVMSKLTQSTRFLTKLFSVF